MDEASFNEQTLIKKAEQAQMQLITKTLSTAIKLIQMAATAELKNQAIMSIPYFETLFKNAHEFSVKWRSAIIEVVKNHSDRARLLSELNLIDADLTNDSLHIFGELNKLEKKNDLA